MQLLVQLSVVLGLLLVGYFAGRAAERRHLGELHRREQLYRGYLVTTTRKIPGGGPVLRQHLVTGSVVVSLDYFKRFLAGLRGIVGGRIRSYESLLDRARREALLRMRESAIGQGFDMVINVRLETSRIASGASGGKGTAGVEILAFGTALQLSTDVHSIQPQPLSGTAQPGV